MHRLIYYKNISDPANIYICEDKSNLRCSHNYDTILTKKYFLGK